MPNLTVELPDAAYQNALALPIYERQRRVTSVFSVATNLLMGTVAPRPAVDFSAAKPQTETSVDDEDPFAALTPVTPRLYNEGKHDGQTIYSRPSGERILELQRIEVTRIVEDPEQPRRAIDDAALQGLADSIRQHGVLNPITVAPLSGVDGFRIITGERRWRASQLAGLYDIPCIVRAEPPADATEKSTEQLIENLQREELAPLDKGRAIKKLKETLGATNKETAQRLALSERTVGYLLDLLDLPEEIGEQIISSPNRPSAGNLTEKHGRFLRQLNDNPEAQSALVEKIKGDKLTSEETGMFAKALRENPDQQEEILGEGADGLRKRFGKKTADGIGGGRGGSGGGSREPNDYDIDAGGYDGGPYAGDAPPMFSASRAMVAIAERIPAALGEVRVSAVSNEDLDAVEAALLTAQSDVERLLSEVRRRRH